MAVLGEEEAVLGEEEEEEEEGTDQSTFRSFLVRARYWKVPHPPSQSK
jgi:hypothetical protein